MHRVFIALPAYAFVVFFLPRNDMFNALTEPLRSIHPDIAIAISVVAGLAAGGLMLLTRRAIKRGPPRWMIVRPRLAQILDNGLLGVVFAAVYDVFARLAGYSTDLITLILLPIAFVVSEAAFQAVSWRLNRDKLDPAAEGDAADEAGRRR